MSMARVVTAVLPKSVREAREARELTFTEGWLQRAGEDLDWKKRWVLVDTVRQAMTYYQAEPRFTLVTYEVTAKPQATIMLKGGTIEVVEDPEERRRQLKARSRFPSEYAVVIKAKEPPSTHYLCFRDAEMLAKWLEPLQLGIKGWDGPAAARRRWALLQREMAKLSVSMDTPARHKEGWLRKADSRHHRWTTRWFVLDPRTRTMTYFEDDAKALVKGVVNLRGAEVEVGFEEPTFRSLPMFCIATAERRYLLCADTDAHLQVWVDAVQAVILKAEKQAGSVPLSPYQGWLQKSDKSGAYWNRRFFRFDPEAKTLSYFGTDAEGDEAKGVIGLDGATYYTGTKRVHTPTVYSIVIATKAGRTHYLCADADAELAQWVDRFAALPGITQAAKGSTADSEGGSAASYAKAKLLHTLKSSKRLLSSESAGDKKGWPEATSAHTAGRANPLMMAGRGSGAGSAGAAAPHAAHGVSGAGGGAHGHGRGRGRGRGAHP